MDSAEKRRFPRLTYNVGIEYKIIDSPNNADNAVIFSKNISAGGICIFSLSKFSPGAKLDIKFSLPDSQEDIYAVGRVMWQEEFTIGDTASSRAFEAGVEFLEIQDQDKEKINQYILKHL